VVADPSLTVALRPERDLTGRWGLYSISKDRWLDVVFVSEHEASESLKVLQRCRLTSDIERPSGGQKFGF